MWEKRLGLGTYLGLWFGMTAVQLGIAAVMWNGGLGVAALAVFLVGQCIKVVPAAWRLNDLGRPADDAILALLPVANIGLFNRLLARTPSDAERDALRARWAGELTAAGALAGGFRAIGRIWYVAVPVAVGAGLIFNTVDMLAATRFHWVRALGVDESGNWISGLLVVVVLLLGYTVIQFFNRAKVTRASWFPSLFLLPSILVLGGFVLASDPSTDAVLVMALFANAWTLIWYCFGEAFLAGIWVTAADHHARGEAATPAALFAPGRRLLAIAGPHGAMVHAVQLGAQVIVPGIYYAIQFAFVDAAVVIDPEKPSLKVSSELTRGIRRRLFKVFWCGFAGSLVLWLSLAGIAEVAINAEKYGDSDLAVGVVSQVVLAYFYLPPGASNLVLPSLAIAGAAATLVWAVTKAAFTLIYLDRMRVKGGE